MSIRNSWRAPEHIRNVLQDDKYQLYQLHVEMKLIVYTGRRYLHRHNSAV